MFTSTQAMFSCFLSSFVHTPLTLPWLVLSSFLVAIWSLTSKFASGSSDSLVLLVSGSFGAFEAGILLFCLPRPCALVLVFFLFAGLAPRTRSRRLFSGKSGEGVLALPLAHSEPRDEPSCSASWSLPVQHCCTSLVLGPTMPQGHPLRRLSHYKRVL